MQKRVIWKMLLLTIVTLGIYRLYWFIKTRREMIKLNPNVKIMSPVFLFIPIMLVLLSVGFLIISTIKTVSNQPSYCRSLQSSNPSNFNERAAQSVLPKECQSNASALGMGLVYLSVFLFYPLMVAWLWGYSKGVETITGGHTSFPIALIILLLIPDGIDILIIQDSFNKLADIPPTSTISNAPTPIAS